MADSSTSPAASSSASNELTLNIKGPSDIKLSVTISADATVEQLKQKIAEQNPEFPTSSRLIYSGRILKDEQVLASYGVKNGAAVHLVKGARTTGSTGSSTTPAARGPSEAVGVPSTFGAGQQVMGNPLAPLMNAQYAGQLGGFNPFAEMGINPNDPNYVQNMMNSPEVQAQMNQLLSDPAVLDQVIASNPQLQAMGPQVRQIMQSEHFRNFITNPQAMNNMMQMMGGGGGGAGSFPPPGAFGFGSGQANPSTSPSSAPGAGANLFNPWASTPANSSASTTGANDSGASTGGAAGGAGAQPTNPNAAMGQGAFNPFRGFDSAFGQGGQAPDLGQMMQQLQQLQQLQNMFGGGGGAGGNGAGMFGGFGGGAGAGGGSSGPQVSPEERYSTQLEQMASMGFTDASRNVRALLAAGGNVEVAIGWLFDNPQ
ncbi:hypothetical protein JCM10212_005385 [Sporobolomyces blumeae]